MTITALLLTTIIIILGIYDLVVVVLGYCRGRYIAFSISRFMQWLPRKATFFVCVVFYCMGHFWGPMTCPDSPPSASVIEPVPEMVEANYGEPIPVHPRGSVSENPEHFRRAE